MTGKQNRWPGVTRIARAGFVVGAALLFVGCSAEGSYEESAELTQSIYGGTEASPGEYPGLVNVVWRLSDVPWHCGGTLISPRHVLTAGHCLDEKDYGIEPVPADFEVVVGRHHIHSNEGEVVDVGRIILHPDFVSPYGHDIVILELSRAVSAKPARVLSPARMSEVHTRDEVRLVGWGYTPSRTGSEVPLAVSVLLRGIAEGCEGLPLPPDGDMFIAGWAPHRMCVGRETETGYGACGGDSGGPAYVRRDNEWFVIGVTSYGSPVACGRFDMYTYVPDFFDWVHANAPGVAPSYLPSAQILEIIE